MLMDLTAVVALAATMLHWLRFGHQPSAGPWDRVGRLGVGAVFVAVSTGLIERARVGDPFEWFHWIILGAFTVCTVGYSGVITTQLRVLHRVAHGLGRSSCHHPACDWGRAQISGVTGARTQADQLLDPPGPPAS